MSLDDGSVITHAALKPAPPVRVFNRDFVDANFEQEHTAPAVFILGSQNVALRQRLEALNRRHKRVLLMETKLRDIASSLQRDIDQIGTDKARDVGNLLGDRSFRRPKLLSCLDGVRAKYSEFILADPEVYAKYEICRSTTVWTTIAAIKSSLPDFKDSSAKIAALLSQTASNRAIEKLKTNQSLESWLRTGLALHQGIRECEFCGSAISDARLSMLKGHFSLEYEALVRDLAAAISECTALNFAASLPDERDFMPDLKSQFIALKKRLGNWETWAADLRAKMTDALSQKQLQIESSLPWQVDLSRAPEGESLILEINELVTQHNQTVAVLGQTRSNARTALEQHHAALFFRDSELSAKEYSCAKAREKEAKARTLAGRISAHVAAIELQVRQQSIGAANLNDMLCFLLAESGIGVVAVGDGLFEFRRDGAAAENLSDGERTAIAFAYFLTSLEANGANPADLIVFIDDPISSLDSNHIYAIYSLISESLSACRQVFVSTHNSELFNLMKDKWFDPRKRYANTASAHAYYTCRSIDGNGKWSASIDDLPTLLRKHKSEYHFVFEQLHRFATAHAPSLHEAYTAPNLLRKYLEAYLGFRKPSVSKWSDKLDLLFDTPLERREIQKFADDASHLHGFNRLLQQPNFITTSKDCVNKVIAAMKAKDFNHYESLCEVIGVAP